MNTFKYILLIFLFGWSGMVMATDYPSTSAVGGEYGGGNILAPGASYHVEMPDMQFHSTSTMQYSGSSWSSTTSDIGGNSSSSSEPGGRKNVGGFGDNNPGDPGAEENQDGPIGDAVLPLLLLALGYVIYVRREITSRQ